MNSKLYEKYFTNTFKVSVSMLNVKYDKKETCLSILMMQKWKLPGKD